MAKEHCEYCNTNVDSGDIIHIDDAEISTRLYDYMDELGISRICVGCAPDDSNIWYCDECSAACLAEDMITRFDCDNESDAVMGFVISNDMRICRNCANEIDKRNSQTYVYYSTFHLEDTGSSAIYLYAHIEKDLKYLMTIYRPTKDLIDLSDSEMKDLLLEELANSLLGVISKSIYSKCNGSYERYSKRGDADIVLKEVLS